jgi:hypothetical protein
MAESHLNRPERKLRQKERLVALVLLGVLLFNEPLLGLFDRLQLWFGIPLLYLYLFTAWGAFILLAALILERAMPHRGDRENK